MDKYKLPRNHPLLLELSQEELMIEQLQDAIERDPAQAFPKAEIPSDYVVPSGDSVVDEWQRKAANDEEIDFLSSFAPEDRERLKKYMTGQKPPVTVVEDEFKDSYKDD